ncbi:HP1 family phage holin [Salmonella enterica]
MDKHTTWLAYIWALISGICAQWTLNDYGALIGIVLGIGTFLVNKHYKKKSEQAQARQAAAMEERNRLIARILEKNDHDSTLKMLAVPAHHWRRKAVLLPEQQPPELKMPQNGQKISRT